MSLKKQKIILGLCLFLTLSTPALVSARGLVPCGGYKDDGTHERACNVEDIFILIARVTNWLVAFAGVYAVYMIVGGGFWLIVSMGNEEAITKRKSQISSAVVGLVLVFMAYMFINTTVNLLLSRNLAIGHNPKCALDLKNPLTYLAIDPKDCSSLPEETIHTTP